MDTLLDNGKYKVLENLLTEPDYTASVCIDVETKNNYKPLIFNTYLTAEHINRYLPLFYSISHGDCSDFVSVIPGDGCIMAVFNYHNGIPLAEYLQAPDEKDYPARAAAISSFLDAVIILDMLPPVFAISALSAPNAIFDKKEGEVRFNFLLRPRGEPTDDEKRAVFVSYLECAFKKNRYLPESVSDFLEDMRSADISKFVPICAAWRQLAPVAREEYESYLQESYIGYLKRRIKTKAKKRKEKKKNR